MHFDKPDKPSCFTAIPSGSRSSTPLYNSGTSGTNKIKFISKLDDEDREYLKSYNGCTNCRRINIDHGWWNCPDKRENSNTKVDNTVDKNEKKTNKVKKELVNQVNDSLIDESKSDSKYSSIATIKIHTILQDIPIEGVADSGVTVNLLFTELVQQ